MHMIKTKHYENVPSLRMWSQKQAPPPPENPSNARKRSVPPMSSFKKPEASPLPSGVDPQALFRSPFGMPPFMPGIFTFF